jgi:hypothetical protein
MKDRAVKVSFVALSACETDDAVLERRPVVVAELFLSREDGNGG